MRRNGKVLLKMEWNRTAEGGVKRDSWGVVETTTEGEGNRDI
jgi:hypothetical protein